MLADEVIDCSVTSARTEAEAREAALACGTEMLVDSKTDPWSTTSILPDGYARLSSSIDAVRAPDPSDADGDGTPWRPVDATLVGDPVDGRITMAAPAADLTFSAGDSDGAGAGGPLASLTTAEGHTVTVDVPFDLPAPVVDVAAGQVIYPVATGVDVVVTPNLDGTSFSEVIRAESVDALNALPALVPLTGDGLVFPVTVSDGLALRSKAAGGFDVTEIATAEVVAELPAPRAWDSAADAVLAPAPDDVLADVADGSASKATADSQVLVAPDGELIDSDGVDERRASAPVAGDAIEPMRAELLTDGEVPAGADAGVVVTLDPEALAGMDGVIHIDPTTGTKRPGGKAVIQSAYPSSVHYNDASSFPIGACTASIGCPTTNVIRSAFQWTGLSTIAGLKGSDIREATFTVYGSHTYACSSRITELYRTAGISSSTNWNNFTVSGKWQSKVDEKNIHHKPACSNARDIAWDVKSVARWAADNNSARITLGLKGTSTTDVYTWKRYENPRLEIIYNRAPLAPRSGEMKLSFEGESPEACSTTSADAPSFSSTSGITMRGIARDPDSPQVRVKFMVLTSGGTMKYETADWSTWKTPGSTFEKTIPSSALSGGGSFQWRMIVQDALDNAGDRNTTWGQSPNCYFKVDLTNPATPTITSTQYPQGEISGGVGISATFVLDSASSDVVTYRYSLNSDGLGSSKSPSSPGGPVTVGPLAMSRAGSHILYAQALDASGRTSGTRTYRYTVDFPTTAGYWHLDDFAPISGSTSKSSPDDGALGHTLRLSSGVGTAEPGPFALNGRRLEDKALLFDGSATDTASTTGPVVNTFGCASDTTGPDGIKDGKSEDQGLKAAGTCANRTENGEDFHAGFTVSAFVRADEAGNVNKVAVSQDGQSSSGFKLGKLASTHCPANQAGVKPVTCWGFWTYDKDGGGSLGLRAYSARPIAVGEWVHLAGVFNATSGDMTLSVCPIGTSEDPRDVPEDAFIPKVDEEHGTVEYTGSSWTAAGPVQLGRSMLGGAMTDHWVGAIDEVRLYNAPLGFGQITRICGGDMSGGTTWTPGAELETGEGDDSTVGNPGDIPVGEGDGEPEGGE
ncbi:LamG-like jellyroll fold domain-containing protein [Promicromonospora sp. MS192]|uniref:LamG-like jellyroll fold domain-containing protein n=1 Tax=Promicromonospora sp. MS192 TaxID=3412684 RepID=UPI003C30E841